MRGTNDYELQVLDDALVVRWWVTPTAATAQALREEVIRALEQKRRALWIVIDAEETEPPSPEARAVLQDGGKELFHLAESIDIVLLGSGVRAMLMRTVLRGMALITRTTARLHVHQGVDQAVEQRRPDATLATVLRKGSKAA